MKADAIMTLPELYYKPRSVEQLVAYLEVISSAAPALPLVYYHFPMMSGVDRKKIQKLFFRLLGGANGLYFWWSASNICPPPLWTTPSSNSKTSLFIEKI